MEEKQQKYLYSLKNGEKFIYEDKIYTIYQHSSTMSEVFSQGRFWVWPNWTGKESLKVTPYIPQ